MNNNFELFQHKIFKQMEDLPVIVNKYEALNQTTDISANDVKDFIQDIQELLEQTGNELTRKQEMNRSITGD